MKKIVLAGSSKFIESIEKWKEFFLKKGYDVIGCTKRINAEDINSFNEAYISFFKALNMTDELFVVNLEKNGFKGYIGAETFAEISYIVSNNIIKNENKPIYLLNMPDEKLNCYYELNSFLKLGYIKIWDKEDEV